MSRNWSGIWPGHFLLYCSKSYVLQSIQPCAWINKKSKGFVTHFLQCHTTIHKCVLTSPVAGSLSHLCTFLSCTKHWSHWNLYLWSFLCTKQTHMLLPSHIKPLSVLHSNNSLPLFWKMVFGPSVDKVNVGCILPCIKSTYPWPRVMPGDTAPLQKLISYHDPHTSALFRSKEKKPWCLQSPPNPDTCI